MLLTRVLEVVGERGHIVFIGWVGGFGEAKLFSF